MTEDEAKTKWCPIAAGTNNVPNGENCIASACMAWRWDVRYIDSEGLPIQGIGADGSEGFCGLAGTPEGPIS